MTEEEKPLTREEVLKMIEEHGGPEGLDLSGRNLTGIDLYSVNLCGIILNNAELAGANLIRANLQDRANLEGAELSGAKLDGAHLLYANLRGAKLHHASLHGTNLDNAKLQDAQLVGANLLHAHLVEANLQGTTLRGAYVLNTDLWGADLSGSYLYGVDLSATRGLGGVKWGKKYIVGEETIGQFTTASEVYRNLKKWYSDGGMYDIAGQFYFREMTVKRKALDWWPNPLPRAWSKFLAVLCGYGEKPERVVASAAVVVFGLAGIYSASALSFPSSLYHSAVSFTALGYGLGISTVDGWVKAVGAAEAFMGVFMMALFLITFVRKMTR